MARTGTSTTSRRGRHRRSRGLNLRFRFVSEAAKLERLLSAESRKAMVRMGGFGRTSMKRVLGRRGRKVKGTKERHAAPPGSPPAKVLGTLQRLVFWGFDEARWSVVVGPIPFREGVVPPLHERGGTRPFRNVRTGTRGIMRYPRRPYVERSKLEAMKDLDKAWAQSSTRS